MRRLLIVAACALACAAVPASADPAIDTCGTDDYTVARVEVANVEVAHVCTSENPYEYLPAISCTGRLRPVCEAIGPVGT